MRGSDDIGRACLQPDPPRAGSEDLVPAEAAKVVGGEHPRSRNWSGCGLEPFAVGEAGRAAHEVIPQAATVPFGRPDTVIDGGKVGKLHVRAASARGLASRYSGVTRQDEYCLGTDKERRWLVAAVADGVSAGRHSQVAATIAARRGCQLLVESVAQGTPEKIDWHQTVKTVADVIVAEGSALLAAGSYPAEVAVRDVAAIMAATAGYAVIGTSPGQSGHELHVLAVGDTSAWLLDRQDGWCLLTGGKDRSDQLATSKTLALPYLPAAPVSAVRDYLPPGSVFLMVSDGIGDPMGDASGDVGAFLADVLRHPPEPLTFAGQMCFARRGFDDDRTAVAVWPEP